VRQVAVWRISEAGPRKVLAGGIDIESHLEDWIERDPGLLEAGLTIVGRQVRTDAGVLDLLAIDPQGRRVVIELKRGKLYRDTLVQALDYAACIGAIPEQEFENMRAAYLRGKNLGDIPQGADDAPLQGDDDEGERETRVCVVGTSRDPGLDRLVAFLSGQHGIPITVVTFEVYQLDDGDRIIVRQLAETETAVLQRQDAKARTVEELCERADARGVGLLFRSIAEAAERNGLYLRPWKKSVMAAPPANRTRSLFTVWAEPSDSGELWMWLGPEAFAQFYPPLTEAVVADELGEGGWRKMAKEEAAEFVAGLDRLFSRLVEMEDKDGV
jgi:hypothetical protein